MDDEALVWKINGNYSLNISNCWSSNSCDPDFVLRKRMG
jgi:hypothetical protein